MRTKNSWTPKSHGRQKVALSLQRRAKITDKNQLNARQLSSAALGRQLTALHD
jgi:hypothetical protein